MFYEKFEGICNARNIKPEMVMRSINLTPRAAEHWRNIPSRMPLPTTISKLETFFGVAPGYFTQDNATAKTSEAQQKEKPADVNEAAVSRIISMVYRISQLEKPDRVAVDAVIDALLYK
ncbi:MAG: hypothetical protein VB078_00245 [Clostridiaceae bacterium]|nr:hypothetical protein [Clostridiaceae bacterium]